MSDPDLSYLLSPPGETKQIGSETGKPRDKTGISRYRSDQNSFRYVYFIDGKPVSSLQLVKTRGQKKWKAKIANVWTHPDYRRQGLATKLLNNAKKNFDEIKHSQDLSMSGSHWKSSFKEVRHYIREILTEISQVDSRIIETIRKYVLKSKFWEFDNFNADNKELTEAGKRLLSALTEAEIDIEEMLGKHLDFQLRMSRREVYKNDWFDGGGFNPPLESSRDRVLGRITVALKEFESTSKEDQYDKRKEYLAGINPHEIVNNLINIFEHELTHMYQWGKSNISGKLKSKAKSRKRNVDHLDKEFHDKYLSDPGEIDAYARDSARYLLRMYGFEVAKKVLGKSRKRDFTALSAFRDHLPDGFLMYLVHQNPEEKASYLDSDDDWDQYDIRKEKKRNMLRQKVWNSFLKKNYQYLVDYQNQSRQTY